MMVKKSNNERRQFPRIASNVPVKISGLNGDIVTETGNISRSGAYCRVADPIAPMTKLKVHLLLSAKKNGKMTSKKISCEGVVVRTERVPQEDQYSIAIFFSDIAQRDAEFIADYIASYLEQEA